MRESLLLLATCLLVQRVASLGCMVKVCDGNDKNELRKCPDRDGSCGEYKGKRSDGILLDAIDLRCDAGRKVFAPIDGQMEFFRPFGGKKDKKCADAGVKIEGTGQWQGYVVYISSVELDHFGGSVKAGDELGKAMDRVCNEDESQKGVEPHLQIKVTKAGQPIDPTYHLQQCMCTGQICEGNIANTLLGAPFKSDSRYNGVKGYDIECPMIEEDDEEGKRRAPIIYSPINGEIMGRARTHFDANGYYSGCENDAVFIVGTDQWIDFEVRIYNARYREDLPLGRHRIVQGQPIAVRLTCDSAPDSVFVEIRHQGRVIDVSDMITAESCKLPNLFN
ncbi:lect-2 [Pristionchus pacificus]|uniref:Peptidase n=1 Tax=Pristionchus pacificus TaxID=54126 RepID=A0A2A6B9C5_PRIPA|nr:lect-2 [Pristionchus pacificus]|eukprot:PDM62492.1 Peptidase [Pristionchus pacificus]